MLWISVGMATLTMDPSSNDMKKPMHMTARTRHGCCVAGCSGDLTSGTPETSLRGTVCGVVTRTGPLMPDRRYGRNTAPGRSPGARKEPGEPTHVATITEHPCPGCDE